MGNPIRMHLITEKRLTAKKLEAMAKEGGWQLFETEDDNQIVADTYMGDIHFVRPLPEDNDWCVALVHDFDQIDVLQEESMKIGLIWLAFFATIH